MSLNNKRYWNEIDVLYTIGILLVLVGHSHPSDWSQFQGTALHRIIVFIYTFHMPLFFFIAGFLFQNSDRLNRDGYWKWINDKALRLLTPYFVWSLIAAIPKYYVENGTLVGVLTEIFDVFIKPRASVWGHFWFIPVLFLTYALYGRAAYTINDKRHLICCSLILSSVIFFLPIKSQILGISDLRASLFFFAVGMTANAVCNWLKNKMGGIPWKLLFVLIAAFGCWLLTDLSYRSRIIELLVALLMISVCWVFASLIQGGKITAWVSSHNFTLYIFSWFFQAAMMAVCSRMRLNWIFTFLLMFAAGVIGPVAIVIIYNRMSALHRKPISLIVGER